VPDLEVFAIAQPRGDLAQHACTIELRGGAGIAMRERHVAAAQAFEREGDTDDLGLQRLGLRGHDLERHEIGSADVAPPVLPLRLVLDGVELRAWRCRRLGARRCFDRMRRRRGADDVALVEILDPALELEALEQLAQPRVVALRAYEVRVALGQVAIGANGQQALALRQPVERLAQVVADDATDSRRFLDHVVERAVLHEPLRRCLGADLGHAGNVVDRVAGQRQQVEHLVGTHAELREHARFVERLVAHRIDELDARPDQLREVLVRRRDDRVDACIARLVRQRADDIVRLDTFDHEQRPAVRADEVVQRPDLQR
jgi:phage baseplate assembly protein W